MEVGKVIEQKTVFIEASGKRKGIGGDIAFLPHPDYQGDVAEIDADDARKLLHGEDVWKRENKKYQPNFRPARLKPGRKKESGE